ncbi:hypothetical protein JX265_009350 [Neoarthrinium moseri]|uniref:Uncharacterized protein n=1 Tax=Neoarthrinium moseri TaxID=1658444 RepID=A0A9Q0AMP7_9PEZI|nr:hypothetical protein JX266_013516 [Neoarthrinium moseri]KAI1861847.1 hypothetical protein JX265_009350 [Neoarthrinium moseri]
MIFSSTVSKVIALAMVSTSLASPLDLQPRGDRIVIGYRTVSKAEADSIRKAKTIVYDSKLSSGGKQNGEGVYLTSELGQWPPSHLDDEFCRVTADKDKVEKAKKAWIKQDVEWNEDAVAKAIKDLEDDWKAKQVLRLSKVKGKSYLQLVIPKDMVGHDLIVHHTRGDLDFEAECRPEAKWTQADHQNIDWNDGPFEKNVKGDKQ